MQKGQTLKHANRSADPLSVVVLAGSREMAGRVRALDGARTPLGPMDCWPQSLRALVDTLLSHPLPMILLWGPDLTQIYNDGWAVITGAKHPAALGQPNHECWPELRSYNEPIYERVLKEGEPVLLKDQLIPLDRHRRGTPEEAYFTVSYGPVRDDAGTISGIFVTVIEVTDRVLAERRLADEHLRRSTDTFYHLIQNNPFGVYVVDADFKLTEVSLGAQKVFSHVPRPLLGRDFGDILQSIWSEPFASEAVARFHHTLDTGEPYVAMG